jgi:hypothetical protein
VIKVTMGIGQKNGAHIRIRGGKKRIKLTVSDNVTR